MPVARARPVRRSSGSGHRGATRTDLCHNTDQPVPSTPVEVDPQPTVESAQDIIDEASMILASYDAASTASFSDDEGEQHERDAHVRLHRVEQGML